MTRGECIDTRFALAHRDGCWIRDGRLYSRCRVCGAEMPVYLMSLDHIIPLGKGGHPTDIRNLQLTCNECNWTKGDDMPWNFRPDLYGLWAGKFEEVSA